MPEKSRSGRSCENRSFLAFCWLPVSQERKRAASLCVAKLGHDGGKCLSLRRKFVHFFVVSIMRRDRALLSRSCDTHSSASRAVDGPFLDTSSRRLIRLPPSGLPLANSIPIAPLCLARNQEKRTTNSLSRKC